MGSMGGTGEFERVLAFTLAHPEMAGQLITDQVPFQEYARAFALAQDRKKAMKVLIRF
jgi:threonine dehydrogenase-like Zn-dependent dehydrogenase